MRAVSSLIPAFIAFVLSLSVFSHARLLRDSKSKDQKDIDSKNLNSKKDNRAKNKKSNDLIEDKSDDDFDYGDITVIFSQGRSGSGWFAEVLDIINQAKYNINDFPQFTREILGGSGVQANQIKDPLVTVQEFLKSERKRSPQGMIGFKWKLVTRLNNPKYDPLFNWLVAKKAKGIYSVRNALDVFISSRKHAAYELSAHCNSNNKECIKTHTDAVVELKTDSMIRTLESESQFEIEVYDVLDGKHIDFIDISYDELSRFEDSVKLRRLQEILDFLFPTGDGLKARLSLLDTKMESTSTPSQEDSISNFKEVVSALHGTRFASQMH